MSTAFTPLTWKEAHKEILLHLRATCAHKTIRFYEVQLGQLVLWCRENDVSLEFFGKHHRDRYLVHRQASGKSRMTLRHDAVCAEAFLRWCVKNDLLECSLLAEYEIRRAPEPARCMPTDEEIRGRRGLALHQRIWGQVRRGEVPEADPSGSRLNTGDAVVATPDRF